MRLGGILTLYLFINQSAAKIVFLQKDDRLLPIKPTSRYISADQIPRMMFKTFKHGLVRVVKFYRSMKPEIKLATCFSRYAGIVQGRSNRCVMGECGVNKRETEEEVTVQQFLRDVVHTTMLFMTDLMPQPVSDMMRMAMEVWMMTRNMYKTVKQDEMGGCSLEYMSKRFWWWLGI